MPRIDYILGRLKTLQKNEIKEIFLFLPITIRRLGRFPSA
jgi:hypothetical protein